MLEVVATEFFIGGITLCYYLPDISLKGGTMGIVGEWWNELGSKMVINPQRANSRIISGMYHTAVGTAQQRDYVDIKAYIAVDIFTCQGFSCYVGQKHKLPKIAVVQDDMLLFASRLPDESVNFIMNGLDIFVIGETKYRERLNFELERATEKGGLIIGNQSDFPLSE